MQFKQPPIVHNEQGKLRTVGFELEYSNLSIDKAVQIIRDLYGGEVEIEGRFKHKITGSSLGDFTVEFDLTLLTEKGYRKFLDPFNIKLEDVKIGSGTLEDEVETALESIVGKIFPYEIACPPVPINELHELEKLRESLYNVRAEGTQAFITNAFGTHINVETPSTSVAEIVDYIRAFLLLYPWLLEEGKTDMARKMSPFIAPYPNVYIGKILSPGYAPDLEKLIKDYHTCNPDRNRPLDMYPMFAALNKEQVNGLKGIGKVKPRNTFHYRLPNSSIAEPSWTLAQEWNLWVLIEELAFDKEKLRQLSEEYIAVRNDTIIGFDYKWTRKINKWLS